MSLGSPKSSGSISESMSESFSSGSSFGSESLGSLSDSYSFSSSFSGSLSGSDSFSDPSSQSHSGSGSGGGSGDGGSGGSGSDGGGTTNPLCPAISNIEVQLTRINDRYPEFELCFDEPGINLCSAIVSFDVSAFDSDCDGHITAEVQFHHLGATRESTVAVDSAGGHYQVTFDEYTGGGRLSLYPSTGYQVEVCLYRDVTTPAECELPEGCCEDITWTSPVLGACEWIIYAAFVGESGFGGHVIIQNTGCTDLTITEITSSTGVITDLSPALPDTIRIEDAGTLREYTFIAGSNLDGTTVEVFTDCGSQTATFP